MSVMVWARWCVYVCVVGGLWVSNGLASSAPDRPHAFFCLQEKEGLCTCLDSDQELGVQGEVAISGHYAGTHCDRCDPAYWGQHCELLCPCNNHGTCTQNDGSCICYADSVVPSPTSHDPSLHCQPGLDTGWRWGV